MPQERLQKILAAAGIASRRKAEELISGGRVEVNGQTVTELGTKADSRKDHIRVDGKLLSGPERPVHILLHKPKGYVTTVTDPEGRPTVMDLVRGIQERVFPVGRLDYLSEGLLLLTNDGELMQKLTHAASHVPKSYEVKVSGRPAEAEIDKLRAGILLPPEPTRAGTRGGTQEGMKRRSEAVRTQPAEIELSKDQDNPWYQITLTEGRNRQIRRMFEEIGHHVEKIKRVRYGTLELDVEPGQWRPLSPKEVSRLRASIGKPYVIKPPRRRQDAAPSERRELSAYEIRGLRDRASAEGAEKPKRPMRTGTRPSGPTRDKGAPRPDRDYTQNRGSDRPPRRDDGGRTRFERGRAELREGRMRGDRDRRETPRFERQRPRNDREGTRFDHERPRDDRPTRRDARIDRPADRPAKFNRNRPAGGDRPPRPERPQFDRPRREGAGERYGSTGRQGRTERPRTDRPPRFDRDRSGPGDRQGRSERPRFDRPDRPRSGGPRQDRGGQDRGGKFGKPARRGNDRPGKRNR